VKNTGKFWSTTFSLIFHWAQVAPNRYRDRSQWL